MPAWPILLTGRAPQSSQTSENQTSPILLLTLSWKCVIQHVPLGFNTASEHFAMLLKNGQAKYQTGLRVISKYVYVNDNNWNLDFDLSQISALAPLRPPSILNFLRAGNQWFHICGGFDTGLSTLILLLNTWILCLLSPSLALLWSRCASIVKLCVLAQFHS